MISFAIICLILCKFVSSANPGEGWVIVNGTWVETSISSLQKKFKELKKPASLNTSASLLVPSKDSNEAVLYKDLTLDARTDLELSFSCIIFGWDKTSRPFTHLNNPDLQVLYDDVVVFDLAGAINLNKDIFENGRWNRFKLYSSYRTKIRMRVSVTGSLGLGKSNLIALDRINISMTKMNSTEEEEEEPEIDIQEDDGEWELVDAEQEEESKNVTEKPEFCDLDFERGHCWAVWPRYFYDALTDSCKSFIYSGCGGNDNNFHSLKICENICKKPAVNVVEDSNMRNLSLSFDDGFGNWFVHDWNTIKYGESSEKLKLEAFNKSSKAGAIPVYKFITLIFSRPRLSHPIDLLPDGNLTLTFSLKLVGSVVQTRSYKTERLNPGFKIYVGNFPIYDFEDDGESDDEWHVYSVSKNTKEILKYPHLANNGSTNQEILIEAWEGRTLSGYVVLDDLKIFQTNVANASPSTLSTSSTGLSASITTEASSVTSTRSSTTTLTTSTFKPPSFPCSLPMVKGPCQMKLARFYFDMESRQCEKFTYGGCKGNANNFQTDVDCKNKCMGGRNENDQDICRLKEEMGYCHAYMERFFFDINKKECRRFVYGGCGGNGNNFISKSECQHVCAHHRTQSVESETQYATAVPRSSKDCRERIDKGDCSNVVKMYAFDKSRGKCIEFPFSGCGGNNNLFFSMKQCNTVCADLVAKSKEVDVCNMPKASVTCTKSLKPLPLWYFDSVANACSPYDSCFDSNAMNNQFKSLEQCEEQCLLTTLTSTKASTAPVSPEQNIGKLNCFLDHDSGPCVAHLERYYFDHKENACKKFSYSGCQGNRNNFHSEQECLDFCQGAEESTNITEIVNSCEQPKLEGFCSYKLRRFYFDLDTNSCLEFLYSGCDGNENNFETKGVCEETCLNQLVFDEIEMDEEANASKASVVAEVLIGLALCVVVAVIVYFGIRWYGFKRDAENYRIFGNERSRSGSSLASAPVRSSVGPDGEMTVQVAYDNPIYGGAGMVEQ